MDAGQFVAGISWDVVLTAMVSLYALSVAVFLILENRSPQSTFAWLFLLFLFPLGGLVIYALFGRGRHAFSRERFLTNLLQGTTFADRAAAVIAEQPANLSKLADLHGDYARVATML